MRKIIAGAAFSALTLAAPASAATQIFTENFEGVPNGSGGTIGASGSGFTFVNNAGPWKAGPGENRGIELQWGGVAGAPASNGGNVFVELDTNGNSSMFYKLATSGVFTLDFLYSPRPNVLAISNVIELWLDNTLLGTYTGPVFGKNATTSWSQKSVSFTGFAGQNLIFKAAGTGDSLGGYIDNTTLILNSAVPEPGTWMLMILGLGAVGFAMRRRQKAVVDFKFA
jgi:hypothetical protein